MTSIQSVSSSSVLDQILSLQAASAASSTTSTSSTSLTSSTSDSSSVSKQGGFMSQLFELAKSDPAKLESVASDIASKLKNEASTATGADAAKLSKMADAFSQVAQTGDLSALKPSGPPPGGHHHHHARGAAAYASTEQSTSGSSSSDSVMQDLMSAVSSALTDNSASASS